MIKGIKDPRVRMASISKVDVSKDLHYAQVKISAMGTDEERRAVVSAMRHATGYIRAQLGHTLENLRNIPQLRFDLDESIAYSVHIDSLLSEIQNNESSSEAAHE